MRDRDGDPSARSPALPTLVVAALLVVSGCSAIGTAPDAGADELPSAEAAADRYASLDSITATVTTVQARNGTVTTTVTRKRQRLDPWAYRSRVRSVNRSAGARPPLVAEGGFVVVNGSTFAYYDPASERFSRAEIRASDDDADDDPPYPRLIGAARSGDAVERPTATPGVPSLPTVPVSGGDGNGSAAYREGTVTVAYAGTETVGGRETYRLEVTPNSPNMSLRSETLWLDSEYLYPLKRHVEFVARGTDYEFTSTYGNVTFNPTIEPGTFRVDPKEVPPEAREVRIDNYASASAMAEAVEFPVPEPSVPSGFELDVASYRSTDPEVASLRYERAGTADESRAGIRVFVFGEATAVTSGTPVRVGPHDARRSATEDGAEITWVADGYTYRVSGDVGNETLVAVARSVAETA
jgi:outer membrane lipoprotein-sorting protein